MKKSTRQQTRTHTSRLALRTLYQERQTALANALLGRASIRGWLPVMIAGIAPFGAGESRE